MSIDSFNFVFFADRNETFAKKSFVKLVKATNLFIVIIDDAASVQKFDAIPRPHLVFPFRGLGVKYGVHLGSSFKNMKTR